MITQEEAIKRHQAIEHAFANTLSSEQVQQAITLWDKAFYDSPLFVSKIPLFINKLKDEISIDPNEQFKLANSLARSFTILKNIPLKERPNGVDKTLATESNIPTLQQKKERIRKKEKQQQETMTDDYIIFNAVLHEVISYLNQHYLDCLLPFRDALIKGLPQLKFKSQAHEKVIECCLSMDKPVLIMICKDLSQGQMAEFVDFIYEELCALLGAEATDSLFSSVMKNCDKLPEARRFSPHQLF